MATDSYIQTSLRANFSCTLLTIAHRLNTICDYDRVLVLSFGLVSEFDTPANLLRNPNSVFSSMVNETGEVNAALLRSIAFKAEKGIRVDMAKVLAGESDGHAAADGSNLTYPSSSSSSSIVAAGATKSTLTQTAVNVNPRCEPSLSRDCQNESSEVRWHEVDEQEHNTTSL